MPRISLKENFDLLFIALPWNKKCGKLLFETERKSSCHHTLVKIDSNTTFNLADFQPF
jgi:hypothetical protein